MPDLTFPRGTILQWSAQGPVPPGWVEVTPEDCCGLDARRWLPPPPPGVRYIMRPWSGIPIPLDRQV